MKYLGSSAFMLSFALVAAFLTNLAGIFPASVLTPPVRSNLTLFLLAGMMTLSFSRIPVRDLNLNPFRESRSLIRGLLMGLVIPAIIPVAGYLVLKRTDYGDYAAGLVFIAATPFAASVVPLSLILRGDMVYAARATIFTYIAALIWIPCVAYGLLGTLVDMRALVAAVLAVIALPLVVSRCFVNVAIDRAKLAVVLNGVIFILVWLSVSAADFRSVAPVILLAVMLVIVLRTFALGLAVDVVERKLGISRAQRVSDILIASYKNKGVAIALCVSAMGPLVPKAMAAIAASIVVEVCWVIYMDSVLFSEKKPVSADQSTLAAKG
jgi:BASS family bile acid:Na+ symporter